MDFMPDVIEEVAYDDGDDLPMSGEENSEEEETIIEDGY